MVLRSWNAAARNLSMADNMSTTEPFDDEPPVSCELTEYDRLHLKLYMRRPDAAADGPDWPEAAAILFVINPDIEPARARRVHDAQLARARWMTQPGYRHLLWRRGPHR